MPTMYEYGKGFFDGQAYVPGIVKREVKSLGAKMVTLENGYRYEHRGRFKETFEEAKAALVAELEKQCASWREYLAIDEGSLAAARALTDGVRAGGNTPYDEGPFTLAEAPCAATLAGCAPECEPHNRCTDRVPAGARVDAWQSIKTAPRDGSNILLRFGVDGVSQGKFVPGGVTHPWKFIDTQDGITWLVNHAVDGPGGPSHWQPLPSAIRGVPEPHRCRWLNGRCMDCGRAYGEPRAAGVPRADEKPKDE